MSGFVYNNLELNEYPFTHFRINSYYDARKIIIIVCVIYVLLSTKGTFF